MVKLRVAAMADLRTITEIYNDAIVKTSATFDSIPRTADEQQIWFEKHSTKFPVIVAVLDGVVVGWASLSPWSERSAYAETAEVSLYVAEKHRGRGIGRSLLERLVNDAKSVGHHVLVSRIMSEGKTSIGLHERLGFQHIGVMKEVGSKFGKRLDVVLMQKILDN